MLEFSIFTNHSSLFPFWSQDIPGLELKASHIWSPLCGCPSHNIPPAFLAPIPHCLLALETASTLLVLSHSPGSDELLYIQVGWERRGCLISNYEDIRENSCCFERSKSNSHNTCPSLRVLLHF